MTTSRETVAADLDVDFLLHLGEIQNINLFQIGIYALQAKVYYGTSFATRNLLTPRTMFASPSTLESAVASIKINATKVISCGEVDYVERCYRSRSILIRFRNEKHEFNEGANWRFTVPHSMIPHDAERIICPGFLFIDFDLLFTELQLPPQAAECDDIDAFLPNQPQFKTVAKQTVTIQRIAGDTQLYFPVSFPASHCISLDCMFYACVTGIRYPRLLAALSALEEDVHHAEAAATVAPSGVAQHTPAADSGLQVLRFMKRLTGASSSHPSSHLQPAKLASEQGRPRSQTVNDFVQDRIACVDHLLLRYSLPLINNHSLMLTSSAYILEEYNAWRQQMGMDVIDDATDSASVFTIKDDEIREQMQAAVSLHRCYKLLKAYIDLSNVQLARLWGTLSLAVRSVIHAVKGRLRAEYDKEIKAFWKQQMFVCTYDLDANDGALPIAPDLQMISPVLEHIKYSLIPGKTDQMARDMQVFDYDVHRVPSQLPFLIMEEFATRQAHGADHRYDRSSLEALAKPAKHLIVLVHGFLGCSYDMRLLHQSLLLCCDPNTLVYCSQCNEGRSQDTIDEMAKRFAQEIREYCEDRLPSLLVRNSDEDEGEDTGTEVSCISFIGHSLGGIIVRAALEKEELRPLLDKLHCYVSLASPHLGALQAESQLVSIGMWALARFKQCKSMWELNLDDDAAGSNSLDPNRLRQSYLYQLSLSARFQRFQRIVLVAAPTDQYVPYQSARIEVNVAGAREMKAQKILTEMAQNLLGHLQPHQLIRISIYNIKEDSVSSVNSVLGRTAHIVYVDNAALGFQLVQALLPLLNEAPRPRQAVDRTSASLKEEILEETL